MVETCEIEFFFLQRLLLLKKHFETGMLMSPKNIFILCHCTVHQVYIHIKVVRVDRGGVGTKHRKCFFNGRDQIIKNTTLHYTVLSKGNFSIK